MLNKIETYDIDGMELEELLQFTIDTRDFKRASKELFGDTEIEHVEATVHLHAYAMEARNLLGAFLIGDAELARDCYAAMDWLYNALPENAQWRKRHDR